MKSSNASPVQSVERAVQILELLSAEPSCSISEISRRFGVHRSTAFRLLGTLEAYDLVEQESARGAYRLSFGMLRLASSVSGRIDLTRDAQTSCTALATRLNETVNAAILAEGGAVTITQAQGDQMVGLTKQYVGQRGPLHATSTGKVLLAYASEQEFNRLVERGLESFTGMTMTDPDLLRSELESVRRRGWSSAVAEWEQGINALAVPVRGPQGEVIAALSATAPSFRLPESHFGEIAELLHAEAAQLEARLGYFSPSD
ncbi:IclR family transcriptional regulator [Nesterenkonia aerolata]|uniref:IclR family transcriptional regulator n=1 Tax=Nesterenkonia aerolata TaxID=3074079 RepID=A0ABU2DSL2_9MICC|nr:IclR family transcriptional regulator [Nesterenkonia sp. LY-0111]MDR8019478.1 IclR family transcriptional regulator [Nesterenkonia sp. LY-0111]